MLGHKASCNKFQRIEIIQNLFSYDNGIKINNKKITRKSMIDLQMSTFTTWELSIFPNNL